MDFGKQSRLSGEAISFLSLILTLLYFNLMGVYMNAG